ncbi:MAG: EF2563 family selenium-dependent molybdenum hydroxylase system protein [Candidatus Hydrogenedentota bacterium]|nr:MAG: EF2563 family selenium-dependent molybdenum hydroxylase system protein [Candidatus Hydrogenedentota bacterium]
MSQKRLSGLVVGLKGAGEMASGIAWRLHQANIRKIFMMEIPQPLAVRRGVSFCEALSEGQKTVEGVVAAKAEGIEGIRHAWKRRQIPVIADPEWFTIGELGPDVVVDAILAKRNLGTSIKEAPLVIGLGPGFTAGVDAHMVVETNRGHNLGRIILSGAAEPNTGVPGSIEGYASERVLRAPSGGSFRSRLSIGDLVERGEVVGDVDGDEVQAGVDGVIRGLIASGVQVTKGFKLGDIDPRGDPGYCHTISDKARAVGGAVLEAVLRMYNT